MTRPSLLAVVLVAIGTMLFGAAHVEAAPTKPPMKGLVSMGDIGFHRHDGGIPDNSLNEIAARPGIFGGIVINITWAQVEPAQGRIATDVIDHALESVRAYNRTNLNAPLAVNLRIWPGPNAPDWAKALGGPPVEIHRIVGRQPLRTITIGRFWAAPYRQAWSRMQHELAKKYDADPLIRDVSETSCSTMSDEPFVIAADEFSLASMHRAGYSDDAFRKCLLDSVGDYSGWQATNVHFALNPFRRTDSGKPILTPQVTFEVASAFRRALGSRAVIGHHALRSPEAWWLIPVVDGITKLGPPIEFQTDSPKSLDGLDWDASINNGISLGATAIEVWKGAKIGGFETIPEQKLKQWSATLKQKSAGN